MRLEGFGDLVYAFVLCWSECLSMVEHHRPAESWEGRWLLLR